VRTRVLTILIVVYVFNFVDRNLLSILLESIKADLGVSDTMMGFLVGPAFALLYTFAGIPIARLADRNPRRLVLAVGLAVWSLATCLSGLARNFTQMAMARIAVGVGEASATPTAHSLISDIFPPERRSSALAIYNMGASIGIFVGMALGGFLHDSLGWRRAFIVVGIPGVLFALSLRYLLPEPRRGEVENLVDTGEQASFREVARYLLAQRSFRHVLAAAGLYSITGYGMITWAAPFMERIHGLSPGEFGVRLGLVVGIFGALGSLGSGFLTDALARRDERWLAWIAALGCIGVVPFLAGFALCPTPGLALLLFIPANIFNQFYAAPSYALTQGLARLRMRAMASAMILFSINLIGLGVGPLLIGVANDLLAESYGAEAIRYSLAFLGLFNLWGAAHSIQAARHLRTDLARARATAA